MALFAKSAESKIAADLRSALAKREALDTRLKAAEAAVITRRDAAHALARDNADDAKLDAAEAALRAGEDRVSTLSAALSDIRAQVADLEAQAAKLVDRKQREATAFEIEERVSDLERAGESFKDAAAVLAEAAKRAAEVAIDAHPLVQYASAASIEVWPAVEMTAAAMRHHAERVLAGAAPASLPKAQPPAPVLKVVQGAQLQSVFLLRNVAFTDAAGKVQCLCKMNDAELPAALAKEALRLGAAVPLDDPRRKQFKGSYGVLIPPLQNCTILDSTPKPGQLVVAPGGVPRHSSFEPLPGLRAPFTIKVPREEPMAAATGTRSLPEEE